jgi:hypothetical protein
MLDISKAGVKEQFVALHVFLDQPITSYKIVFWFFNILNQIKLGLRKLLQTIYT